ncbi:nitrilase/cyanide hydratase and apolipoprotein N-acyltransferase [Thecamonas trahens ATCC 50062]|uniref:Nitrilase/cyanide hydratase and apolipoprotein N-acyltransferase n=1 Tax=Thecamonas trahens ATCC 50062 TaxID=461836 RepID=A0A0L0DP03_THETB|nr:nitrilase/cyanide hydratase and apolipoprotein N-acyltransferase [Thecamonas trahens ATCC 50062]KNC54039.1 nitrilase/cyanide hydratase and apolipoprotein N-acyltransferase [Thecamonas trahens ATCC 50062]|eukprot:XP_013754050.1 nitrilase/cyanide hydratase and apolipoprotein N-acyltransferase [Thecamonas trahens ATCC 50062]
MSAEAIKTPDSDIGVALWAANLAAAAAASAALLVLPEYVCEHWLAYAPALAATEELAWLAEQGRRALPRLRPLATKHDLVIVAGSWPVATEHDGDDGSWRNRAHIILPDGRLETQDKLCLTPSEKDPDEWLLCPGHDLRVVVWRELRFVVLICLDVELPALSAKLARADLDLDLLVVPSMTCKRSGHARVFGCAKARAIELQAAVAVVGAVGSVAPDNARPNYSGAAVYLPCEEPLGFTGILAETPAAGSADGDGPLLIAAHVPISRIRSLRAAGAEVWPGAWTADAVAIT